MSRRLDWSRASWENRFVRSVPDDDGGAGVADLDAIVTSRRAEYLAKLKAEKKKRGKGKGKKRKSAQTHAERLARWKERRSQGGKDAG